MPPANQGAEVRLVSAEGERIDAPKAQSGVEYGEGGLAILHTIKGLGNVVTRELPAGSEGGGWSSGRKRTFLRRYADIFWGMAEVWGRKLPLPQRRTAPVAS